MPQRVIATELTPKTLGEAQKRLGNNVMIVKIWSHVVCALQKD